MSNQIELLKQQIAEKQKEIDNFDKEEYASDDGYIDSLDCEGTVTVCGMEFYPSRILKELDPVAYRCGFNDYVDSLDNEEFSDYNDLVTELEELQNNLDDLENEQENNDE